MVKRIKTIKNLRRVYAPQIFDLVNYKKPPFSHCVTASPQGGSHKKPSPLEGREQKGGGG